MTKQEVYQLFGLLQAVYPDAFRGLTDQAAQLKLTVWQEQFRDDPGERVLAAAKAYIAQDKKGFMPVPGQLRQLLGSGGAPGEQEAWNLVVRAASRSTYYAQEEFDKLPCQIRRTLGSPSTLKAWAQLPVTELETVIAACFKRDYRTVTSAPALPQAAERKQLGEGG